jgi:segregation and condensation protein A
MKDYLIKLDVFEGPFDLLLSLIEKEQVDIYQVPLARITSEYLEYIKTASDLNLELAGDFLVMAAVLLKLKSKKLLPVTAGEPEGEEIYDEGQLLEKLVEYKIFKQLAEKLQEKSETFGRVYFRGNETVVAKEYQLRDVSVEELSRLFSRAWQMSCLNEEIEALYVEELSVDEKKAQIFEKVKKNPEGFDFFEIFDRGFIRAELVVGFLAILELVKQKKIKLRQARFLGPILICPFSLENLNKEET